MQKLVLVFLLVIMNSCNSKPIQDIKDTRLLLNLESRIFDTDLIVNTRIFENGIVENIILHSSSAPESIYKTSFKDLNQAEFEKLKELIQELKTINYHNDFPWKEDMSKRNNVYKFQFLKKINTNAFKKENSEEITMPVTYYYYSGLQTEPKVFAELINLIHPKELLPQL
jgi:hypothetical protein